MIILRLDLFFWKVKILQVLKTLFKVGKIGYSRETYLEFDYFTPGNDFLFVEVDWVNENYKNLAKSIVRGF